MNIFFVSIGAVLGAICRWQLSVWLNGVLQSVAIGTLVANVLGCFLIGITLGMSLQDSQKLLFVTGFLGSFTTFSSLWAEIAEKLLQEKWLNVVTIFSLHTLGGLYATLLGILLIRSITSGRFY